jgi:hypothetical protein
LPYPKSWVRVDIDAAAHAGLEIQLLERVLADRDKASCHDAVLAWLELAPAPVPGAPSDRHLYAVPDPPAEPVTGPPDDLTAAIQRLAAEAARLGPVPSAVAIELARPGLRRELDDVGEHLDGWRRSLPSADLGYHERVHVLRLIDRLTDAHAAATDALAESRGGTPSAGAAVARMTDAVELMAGLARRPA